MRRPYWLLSLAMLLICQSACSRPPTLFVTVTGISPGVRSLAILAARVDADGSAVAPMADLVPYNAEVPLDAATFVLRLPE